MADYANLVVNSATWVSAGAAVEDVIWACQSGSVRLSTKAAPTGVTGFTLFSGKESNWINIPAGVVVWYRQDDSGTPAIVTRDAVALLPGGAARFAVFAVGQAAHDAPIAGAPVRSGLRAVSANYAAVATGDTADAVSTLVGAQIFKPYSIPEGDWSYAAAAGGVINTTDVVLAAAAGVGLRRYITSMTLKNANAVVGEVVLKDGATVIWRGHLGATMSATDPVLFPSPLKTTANAALNFACITTGQQVYVNAQGYTAP